MRRILVFILSFLILFAAACSKQSSVKSENAEVTKEQLIGIWVDGSKVMFIRQEQE